MSESRGSASHDTVLQPAPVGEKHGSAGASGSGALCVGTSRLSWTRLYVWSAGGALTATGAAKVFSAFSGTTVLRTTDPVFGVPLHHLFVLVGVTELGVGLACLGRPRPELILPWVAWLAGAILVYRLSVWALDWHGPCGCLGTVASVLPLSPATLDGLMQALLVYLLGGSIAGLIHQKVLRWRHTR